MACCPGDSPLKLKANSVSSMAPGRRGLRVREGDRRRYKNYTAVTNSDKAPMDYNKNMQQQ